MNKSKIEWTESTWNPVTGCSKVSAGCNHCYAERMAKRLLAMGQENYKNGFEVTCHEHVLEQPLKWNKSRLIFVNSMGDLFHEEVPDEFIIKVFEIMKHAKQHRFQVLTKRSERILALSSRLNWTPNIWMGVTVENQESTYRIEHLKKTDAKIKFLSLEPLLSPIMNLNLHGIDWVIVGGESGPGARLMLEEWILDIKKNCDINNIPFFFKQWGGVNKKKTGRSLLGKTWDAMPIHNM